jgi:hypothetical protein
MKAFPSKGYIANEEGILGEAQFSGMDLRDYFAGQVLQAFQNKENTNHIPMIDISIRCYQIADSMMEARKK